MPRTPARRRGLTPLERRNLRNGLIFISPWIIGFVLFLAYPIAQSFYYSLCDFSVLRPPRFIGLANYQQLASDDVFLKALSNTIIYALCAIPLGSLVAFGLAMLLNTGVRGMPVYRTLFFLPSLVPSIALAILWTWILNGEHGALNYALQAVGAPLGCALWLAILLSPWWLGKVLSALAGTGLASDSRTSGWWIGSALGVGLIAYAYKAGWVGWGGGSLTHLAVTPPNWLGDTLWVKPALILVSLWGAGNAMVIYLAGLQDVPAHLYEAADLDGASWWRKTWAITLPMMSPVILFNGVMAIIGTFNFFAIPFVMTPGGQPAREAYFLAVNLYDTSFLYLRMGYAAAMAWVLFLIIFCLTMLAMKLSAKHVHYAGL